MYLAGDHAATALRVGSLDEFLPRVVAHSGPILHGVSASGKDVPGAGVVVDVVEFAEAGARYPEAARLA